PLARHLTGAYLESAERLGQRTAQLHQALSQVVDDPVFAPEPFGAEYRQSQFESMMRGLESAFTLLKDRLDQLSASGQATARMLLQLRPVIVPILGALEIIRRSVPLTRCHGYYPLGQGLCTEADFIITDNEGQPARSLAERREKHPALVD